MKSAKSDRVLLSRVLVLLLGVAVPASLVLVSCGDKKNAPSDPGPEGPGLTPGGGGGGAGGPGGRDASDPDTSKSDAGPDAHKDVDRAESTPCDPAACPRPADFEPCCTATGVCGVKIGGMCTDGPPLDAGIDMGPPPPMPDAPFDIGPPPDAFDDIGPPPPPLDADPPFDAEGPPPDVFPDIGPPPPSPDSGPFDIGQPPDEMPDIGPPPPLPDAIYDPSDSDMPPIPDGLVPPADAPPPPDGPPPWWDGAVLPPMFGMPNE